MFAFALLLIFAGYPVAFSLGGTAVVFAFVGVAFGLFDWALEMRDQKTVMNCPFV